MKRSIALIGVLAFSCSAQAQTAQRRVQIRDVNFQTGVIELFNFGATNIGLNGWRICTHDFNEAFNYTLATGLNGVTIEAGTSVFIHFNNDAPVANPDRVNRSTLGGGFAGPLDQDAYGMQLFFPINGNVNFSNSAQIADHIQWNIAGQAVGSSQTRTAQAVSEGLWNVAGAFIATQSNSASIALTDLSGDIAGSPAEYAVIAPPPVAIDFRPVGDPGNAGDPNAFGRGAVAYEYRIGTFEVTNAQYAQFLNAVAASDPRGLYNPSTGTDPRGGITRSGTDGSFTYAVKPNMGNKPVNYVSFFDAARMANWLTNGQGLNGGSGSTESGVYTLNGNILVAITRDLSNPNQIFLPTQNEFIKAGYHQPASQGGDTDNFWRFATRSNLSPFVAAATATGDIANPSATRVNYNSDSDWNGQNGNVTTVGSAGNTSFYGAFDMNGNVREWLETTAFAQGFRGQMGGDYQSGFDANPNLVFGLDPAFIVYEVPTIEGSTLGIRFASPVVSSVPPCLADYNEDDVIDGDDVIAFFADWDAGLIDADVNNDDGVDGDDILVFFSIWDQGGC